jgi:hypothetical protein
MEDNLDVNILIQSFSDRVAQLTNDLILKDAVIKQLTAKIEELNATNANIEKEDKDV